MFLQIYALFLLWLFFVAFAIAAEPTLSLREIKSQWLPPTLCLLIAIGATFHPDGGSRGNGLRVVRIVFWAFVAHAALQLLVAAWTLYGHGSLDPRNFGGISDHKANVTYTNALAFSLLLADIVFHSSVNRLLGLSRRMQALLSFALLASTYVSATRNGIIVLLSMVMIGMLIMAVRNRRGMGSKWLVGVALSFTVLTSGGLLAVKMDARWQGFIASFPVGWDIDSSHAWVNTRKYTPPLGANGKSVELSAYERAAFARAALRLIAEHPLGTQVSREAFKKLVSLRYSDVFPGHPHNGYLELGVSIGLPGMLLWVLVLGAMLYAGGRHYLRGNGVVGLALLLVAAAFGIRCLLDSIVREHILQEFMLTCGVLWGCLMREPVPHERQDDDAS